MTNINTENRKWSNELLERAIRDVMFDYVARKGYIVNDERAAELIAVLLPWVKVSTLPIGRANQWIQMTYSELIRSDCPFGYELAERLSEFGPGLTVLDVITLGMHHAKRFSSVRSVIRIEYQSKQSAKAAKKAALAVVFSSLVAAKAEKAKAAKKAVKAAHKAAMAARKERKTVAAMKRRAANGERVLTVVPIKELVGPIAAKKAAMAAARLAAVKPAANKVTTVVPSTGTSLVATVSTSKGGGDSNRLVSSMSSVAAQRAQQA